METSGMAYLARRYGGFTSPWEAMVDPQNGEDAYSALLDDHLSKETTVLETGCGHGAEALRLAERVKQVIAFDATSEFIDIAEEARRESNVENVQFLCADCSPKRNAGRPVLPVPDQSVDLVISRRGPSSWIGDSPRAVRPGGALIHLAYMVTPEPPWNHLLPLALRVRAEPETMPGVVLTRLSEAGIPLHSAWSFDVPEVLASPEELYKRLVWDRRDDPVPRFEECRECLEQIFDSFGGEAALRQRRFLWKAVV